MKAISLSVIIAFLVGAIAAAFADPYLPAALSNTQKGYQAGFGAAKTLVENSSLGGFFTATPIVRALSGNVTMIRGDQITLRVHSLNPFDDPALMDRIVVVDASTTVAKIAQKNPTAYQAELAAFMSAQKTATTTGVLPVATIITPARLSDIAVGDSLNVVSAVNIKTMEKFVAQSIQILPPTSSVAPAL
ncbi:MAG TPA: hypothetical protein VMV62_00285 [Candidatus Paceibacterota bacterium]|nr:hypothetical protein [Candidatus Paceibacterota bacterium]